MKNIHVLLTDKPSRLFLGNNGNFVFGMIKTSIQSRNDDFTNQHIYITSDEEIKVGDWHFKNDKMATKSHLIDGTCKKIILTTDQDLIKDGVQAIDDEFLEWFVKNPSCEEVEVVFNNRGISGVEKILKTFGEYEIIIPKEEQKQHLIDIMEKDEELGLYDIFNDEKRQGVKELIDKHKQTLEKYSERFDNDESEIGNPDTWGKRVIDKHKQDDENYLDSFGVTKTQFEVYRNFNKQKTLDEIEIISKQRIHKYRPMNPHPTSFFIGFKDGTEWQQERSYSEEDMIDYSNYRLLIKKALSPKEWFEQIKKKNYE